MDVAQTIERLKYQLSEVRAKHAEAKMRVRQLQLSVGPTSRELSEAKTLKVRLKDEIAMLERRLKQYGLSEDEIAAVGAVLETAET